MSLNVEMIKLCLCDVENLEWGNVARSWGVRGEFML